MADTAEIGRIYESVFGELVMIVGQQERRTVPWPNWAITTQVDTAAYTSQIWEAIACHRSQLPGYEAMLNMPVIQRQRLFAQQYSYCAFSLVNGGRAIEKDLFTGLGNFLIFR